MNVTNQDVVRKLLHIHKLHRQRMAELVSEFGMLACHPHLFFYLSKHKNPTQKELAGALRVSPPTMTVTLQRLEKAGYIVRRPDETDARVVRVGLTEKGDEVAVKARNALQVLEEELMEGFSQEEKSTLLGFLQRGVNNLGGEGK